MGIHTIRDITIRDMIIDLRIDIIVLNLSYFMLCDDCKIATYVYILWVYLYSDHWYYRWSVVSIKNPIPPLPMIGIKHR